MNLSFRQPLVIATLLVACASPARAQGDPPPSIYEKIWSFAELYRSADNPIVQRIALSGRYHQDFALLEADQGDVDEWNVRRLRVGPRLTLFRTWTVHAEFELNPQEHDPFYVRLTDAYVEWSPGDHVAVTAGKQGMPFTLDGSTSSRNLLTIDRSNLANNMWFPQEYLPGVSVSGEVAAWTYHAGVYSAGAANREFGEFSGGATTLTSLGYDAGDALGVDAARLAVSYVFQQEDAANTFTRQLDHITSVTFALDAGRWGAQADVSGASGYLGQPGMWGLMLMPHVDLTARLQAVGRYTFLDSDGPNGLRLPTYESRIVSGRGDAYHDVYGGVNYYFYGQRLKLQTGLQFADMRDRANDGGEYSGWSWTTGLRVGW